jgi:hypothetical protein
VPNAQNVPNAEDSSADALSKMVITGKVPLITITSETNNPKNFTFINPLFIKIHPKNQY